MDFKIASPNSVAELLTAVHAAQGSPFRLGAGYTDLLLLLEQQPIADLTVIDLGNVKDKRFTSIANEAGGIRIGAMVTANAIIDDPVIAAHAPVLTEAAASHASRQIRQVATIGGNLCTASPAGDMACALVALEARCEILSVDGNTRSLPIAQWFRGLRKTDLQPDEILHSVFLPIHPGAHILYSHFVKVGTRRSMECAVVSLASHVLVDEHNTITHAGVAIGSAAPVTRFATKACEMLLGMDVTAMTSAMAAEFADHVVSVASPISDIRGSAWYRTEALRNLSRAVIEEILVHAH